MDRSILATERKISATERKISATEQMLEFNPKFDSTFCFTRTCVFTRTQLSDLQLGNRAIYRNPPREHSPFIAQTEVY
jgi:hypothetical protein